MKQKKDEKKKGYNQKELKQPTKTSYCLKTWTKRKAERPPLKKSKKNLVPKNWEEEKDN